MTARRGSWSDGGRRKARGILRCADGTPWGDHRAEVAQSVEHATENRGVASSILALGTIFRRWSNIERKWLSW